MKALKLNPLILLVLLAGLVILGGYTLYRVSGDLTLESSLATYQIGFDAGANQSLSKDLTTYRSGYQAGFNDALTQSVLTIFDQVQKQGYVQIFTGNVSLYLVPAIPQ